MDKLILLKNKINDMVKALLGHRLFAPVDNEGVILFQQITNASELTLEFSNTKIPPKSILFPQTETMFKFSHGKAVKIEQINNAKNKTIIFGIRPCDARSFAVLDHVFKEGYEDPYYLQKRENTLLIGLSCTQPMMNCFCTSFDGGPTATEGMDILLTDMGEKYYVEVITEKGKHLIKIMSKLFTPTTNNDDKKKNEIDKRAETAIKRYMNTEGIAEKLDEIFESSFWKTISIKCLGCRICTYLCPTCHCFDIQDETTIKTSARVRVWDSCMCPEHTLQASGYNPRPERMNRVKNRIYHKHNYYPKNYDVIACVGCGRCIDACPANIDIIDVITRVKGGGI